MRNIVGYIDKVKGEYVKVIREADEQGQEQKVS